MITNYPKILRIIALLVLCFAVIISVASLILANRDASVYPSSLYAGPVYLGNLSHYQAVNKLQDESERLELSCTVNQEKYSFKLLDLGVRINAEETIKRIDAVINGWTLWDHSAKRVQMVITPAFEIDLQRLQQSLSTLAVWGKQPAIDAQILLSGDRLLYQPEQAGWQIDLNKSVSLIPSVLQQGQLMADLPVKPLLPRLKVQQLEQITDLLSVQAIPVQAGNVINTASRSQYGAVILPDQSADVFLNELTTMLDDNDMRRWSQALSAIASEAGLQYLAGNQQIHNQTTEPVALFITREGNFWLIRVFGHQSLPGRKISITREYDGSLIKPTPSAEEISPPVLPPVPGKPAAASLRIYRHDFIYNNLIKTTLLGEYNAEIINDKGSRHTSK